MRKRLFAALVGVMISSLANAQAVPQAQAEPPGGPPPPAGGVVIPQEALQVCHGEGGCVLTSRARLQAIEAAAMLAGAMQILQEQAKQPRESCRREAAPGVGA